VSHTDEDILSFGKEAFDIEGRVLLECRDRLNQIFVESVKLIHQVKQRQGHVIVSGVGKSGLVARKWAATFTSTGTPAFFVDAVEAAHGDLGAVRSNDLVILLSASGETDELAHLIRFTKEHDVPLIVVTLKRESRVARSADLVLEVEVSREACPLGLAPTASSTAMMAMGDAVALSLMRLSGFSAEDFAKVHPGGALGRKVWLKVNELMHAGDDLPVVSSSASMDEVVVVMTRKKLGAAVVIDGFELKGIVTDGDLRRFLQNKQPVHGTVVKDVMTPNPKTIQEDRLAFEAYMTMSDHKITQLVVVSAMGRVSGLLHIHDLFRARIAT
jgi:arabinose-5-phosphate isomerase